MDLQSLISNLYQNAPAFKERMRAAKLKPDAICTSDDLRKLPVIRKDNLAELQAANPPFGGMLTSKPSDLKRIFQSPGPIYEPETRINDYWRWASALRAAGFGAGDIVINTFTYHLTPAGAMFEEGLWAVGATVIAGGVGNQVQQVQMIHALNVNGYVGLPSYLKALLEKSDEMTLPLKITKAFVTAEPLPPSLRSYLNGRGITVRQGYGTAECGNLGYECDQENGWHVPDDVIIEVCDINTGLPSPIGETGEIVATLFNADYAMVRFGLGDLSSLNPEPCACGRKTPRLMGWQGRVGEATKVRGMFLHPRQLRELLAHFPEVTRWQAVVSRVNHKDYLTLRVATSDAKNKNLSERLKNAAHEAIKFNPTIEVVAADSIPPDAPAINDIRKWE